MSRDEYKSKYISKLETLLTRVINMGEFLDQYTKKDFEKKYFEFAKIQGDYYRIVDGY